MLFAQTLDSNESICIRFWAMLTFMWTLCFSSRKIACKCRKWPGFEACICACCLHIGKHTLSSLIYLWNPLVCSIYLHVFHLYMGLLVMCLFVYQFLYPFSDWLVCLSLFAVLSSFLFLVLFLFLQLNTGMFFNQKCNVQQG